MTTIGGGVVLDNNPPYRKRHDQDAVEELNIKKDGSNEERLELVLKINANKTMNQKKISRETNLSLNKVKDILKKLQNDNRAVCFESGREKSWLGLYMYQNLNKEIIKFVDNYHQDFPLRKGIQKEELRTKLSAKLDKKEFDELLNWLRSQEKVKTVGPYIASPDFKIVYEDEAERARNMIMESYKNNFMPHDLSKLQKKLEIDDNLIREVVNSLRQSGHLVKVDRSLFFHPDVLKSAEQLLIDYLQKNGEIGLAEFRDLIESSRKYALPLLKHFDNKGIITRKGDKRILA
jgi:selenocysteine-specific elongation factor